MDTITNKSSSSAERVRRHRQRQRERQQEVMYEPTDWQLFLNLNTLTQEAGCHADKLPALILKEVADNALDNAENTTLQQVDDNTWVIDDEGPGLSPEQIKQLFAVNRRMRSSKRKRLPLRGMLGNGLRVVMGGATVFGGWVSVESRGRKMALAVDTSTGETLVVTDEASEKTSGLRVTVCLGHPPAIASLNNAAILATNAITIATRCEPYSGPSNPWWYGPRDLEFLFKIATPITATVRKICRDLGLWYQGTHYDRQARTLTLDEVEVVLNYLRGNTKPIKPEELGEIGEELLDDWVGYGIKAGITQTPSRAHLPYIVEAWATCKRSETKGQSSCRIDLLINRSLTLARLTGLSQSKLLTLHGCGIVREIKGPGSADYEIWISVISPYIDTINRGKEPELKPYSEAIVVAVGKACRQAFYALGRPPGAKWSIKSAGYEVMVKAYMSASGDGQYPANLRQIMYAARPDVLRMTGKEEFTDSYFIQTVIRGYLADRPEQTATWDVVADARGHFTEPHTGKIIGLGTLAVRGYMAKRAEIINAVKLAGNEMYPTNGPQYRLGAALFIEKEGFDPLWEKALMSERYDIGLMSTKGLSVGAARMLVDWLVGHGVKVLVLHDFDVTGFKIFGTLGTDSKVYKFKNEVKEQVIDIGLRLEDVRELELTSEPVKIEDEEGKHAATLKRHGATAEEIKFLLEQTKPQRVELNMLNAPAFVQFLETKFEQHGIKKVVPPSDVLEAQARRIIERDLTQALIDQSRAQILQEAAAAKLPKDLAKRVATLLKKHPELSWDAAVARIIRG